MSTSLIAKRAYAEAMTAAAPFMRATIISKFNVVASILVEKTWVLDTDAPLLVDFGLAMMTYFCKIRVGKGWIQSNLKRVYKHMNYVLSIANWDAMETRPKITGEEALQLLKHHGSDTSSKRF